VARFGRLDVAVNNAGTEGQPGPLVDQTAESYAATFDTNVLGAVLSMKHELRVMLAQGSGSIVNLSSTMGHRGNANGASVSTASKHAVEGLTRKVRRPGGRRVRGPRQRRGAGPGRHRDAGPLHRRRGPQGRPGRGRAHEARWAARRDRRGHRVRASDQASFITGQIIDVNGGKTAF
jgi:NAD(P)-dependent dehydrogenase (short-subunit alcohol dehydrogenase family)